MSTPQNKAPQPVASLDRQRRPHSAQRPQIPVRLPAGLCSHLEAGLGEHPGVSSSSRSLQDSCPAATRCLLAFTGGLRLGGSPPHPQPISATWYLVVTRTCADSAGWKQVHFLPNQGEGRPQRVDARGRSEAMPGSGPTATGCHLLQGRLPFPDPAASQPVLGSWCLS